MERQRRGKYTPENFYEHGKNRLTYKQMAQIYEVGENAVGAQLAKPVLKAAYKAGKNGEPFPGGGNDAVAAVDEHFCTETGIKNHAGFAPSFDISYVLKGMVVDRKLRREADSDVVEAYFRFKWKVKRFWRDGTAKGKVGIEFETADGVNLNPASLVKTKAEIYRKLAEISELLKAL